MEPLYKDRDWLYEQYVVNNLSANRIASNIKCNTQTICNWLKKYSIKKTVPPYMYKRLLYHLYVDLELTYRQIGTLIGYSEVTINNWCKKYNINTRSTGVEIECTYCGKNKIKCPSQVAKNPFCSLSCFHSFNKGSNNSRYSRVRVPCNYCGTTLVRKYYTRNTLHFCNNKCLAKYTSKNMSGANSPLYTQKLVLCKQCNTLFSIQPYRILSNGNYCSPQCHALWNRGENASNWLGGKSFEPYPSTFNEPFKKLIRERDNYTCALCEKEGKDVHHIDYIKENTIPVNCITLCNVCHSKTNGNRKYWQEVLTNIMTERNLINE